VSHFSPDDDLHEDSEIIELTGSVPTPITVTHKIAVEVLFSVWGEDEMGNKLENKGPGAVRALMIEKSTMVASVGVSAVPSPDSGSRLTEQCAFTPEELRLPSCAFASR
jgi:hypothetical protein